MASARDGRLCSGCGQSPTAAGLPISGIKLTYTMAAGAGPDVGYGRYSGPRCLDRDGCTATVCIPGL